MNPSKGLGNANLKVIRDIYNSIHYAAFTLQRDHVHGIKLSQAASMNVAKRQQIDHRERDTEYVGLLSREQGSFIAKYVRGT